MRKMRKLLLCSSMVLALAMAAGCGDPSETDSKDRRPPRMPRERMILSMKMINRKMTAPRKIPTGIRRIIRRRIWEMA